MQPIIYLSEPVLNSELVLINNSKLLKKQPELLNEIHLPTIKELRNQFIKLDQQSEIGIKGLQKDKKILRDQIRDLSSKTFSKIDENIFGSMIITIVNKISSLPQFSNYTYIDEMRSLAIQHILLYSYKFDPFRQSKLTGQYVSAFAYISTICFNAFVATINKFNKEQSKAKEQFLEKQKLIHKEPNKSHWGPDFSVAERTIQLPNLLENELYNIIKSTTINADTVFYIPENYKLSEKEYNFIIKYEYNISIKRIKIFNPTKEVVKLDEIDGLDRLKNINTDEIIKLFKI